MTQKLFTLIQFKLPEILTPAISEIAYELMFGRGVEAALEADLYHRTVTVPAADLEDLFGRCQRDITDFTGPRSLSVGDIAVDLETRSVHVCAPVGWGEIEGLKLDDLRELACIPA